MLQRLQLQRDGRALDAELAAVQHDDGRAADVRADDAFGGGDAFGVDRGDGVRGHLRLSAGRRRYPPSVQSITSPRRTPIVTASVRVVAPNFARIAATCAFTVFSLIASRSAILRFDKTVREHREHLALALGQRFRQAPSRAQRSGPAQGHRARMRRARRVPRAPRRAPPSARAHRSDARARRTRRRAARPAPRPHADRLRAGSWER